MAESKLTAADIKFLKLAYEEAKAGFDEGGCPIGSVLAEGERLIARGRNQRVQQGDPIAHGEMDCLRKAGRQKSYRRMTLYTSLSPCMMCTGTILQFGIPRVVVGEAHELPRQPRPPARARRRGDRRRRPRLHRPDGALHPREAGAVERGHHGGRLIDRPRRHRSSAGRAQALADAQQDHAVGAVPHAAARDLAAARLRGAARSADRAARHRDAASARRRRRFLKGKKLVFVPILRAGTGCSTACSTSCPPRASAISASIAIPRRWRRSNTTASCPRTSPSG